MIYAAWKLVLLSYSFLNRNHSFPLCSCLIHAGSCGTVYHALWYGSDVAVKVFSRQEYSEEMIRTFRQEVSLMKKLRHPNIILFMGAVASQERLCIVTEFLPRGSLFRLLRKTTGKLDPRRRVHMAIDIVSALTLNS
uniref:non-specific serine/threonine protein kinase n=1 Tax=Aegilops tauschii subsp. strangulata TaxID=200361 RepID=A0A453HUE2_AEGTS